MVGTLLTLSATRHPNRLALVFDHVRLTYSQLNARACRLANALSALGIAKGDRVAGLLPNCNEFLEALFGTAKIGTIYVPINFRLAKPEITRILADCTPSVLIYGAALQEGVAPRAATAPFPRHVVRVGKSGADREQAGETLNYESWINRYPDSEPDVHVPVTDVQLILYTSGTTGRSKGVLWTHSNTLFSSLAKIIDFALAPQDVTIVSGPLSHVGPLMDIAIPLLQQGGTVVVRPSVRFDAAHLLAMMQREGVTVVSIYPAMWRRVLALSDLEPYDLKSLRLLLTGGEHVSEALLNEIYRRFTGIPFVNTYGSTEGGPVTTFLAAEDRFKKAGSIGKPAFNVEVRIAGNSGEEVGPGVVGQLLVRSPVVCQGYWHQPQETAAVLRNGWWYTGDLAYRDKDGFLWLAGRSKDMIISGAENIYPVEVEQVIAALEGVAEVAVVGVPDEEWGETGAAFVVRKPGAEVDEARILDHCKANLAGYKKPRHIFFLDELPRAVEAGKISKERLRELFFAKRGGS